MRESELLAREPWTRPGGGPDVLVDTAGKRRVERAGAPHCCTKVQKVRIGTIRMASGADCFIVKLVTRRAILADLESCGAGLPSEAPEVPAGTVEVSLFALAIAGFSVA